MTRLTLAVLFLFSFSTHLKAQGGVSDLSKEKFITDFDIFQNTLEKAHAGLYKYHPKKDMDRQFALNRAAINERTNQVSFYSQLSSILSYIGSLHDNLAFSERIKNELYTEKGYFPYPVKLIDKKLLINISGQNIPVGAEIISINGRKTKEILPHLYHYTTSDGFNLTGKTLLISNSFPLVYRLEFGTSDKFNVVYKPFLQKENTTVEIPSSSYNDYKIQFEKRHSILLDTLLKRKYAFQIIDNLNTGILTVNTFSFGGRKNAKHLAYKAFLRKTFETIKLGKIKNLIVDIRKNGGGSDPNDLMTFTYLAHQPFKENMEAYTLFQQLPDPQYSKEDSTDIRELEKELKEEHNRLSGNKYYQDPSYNPFWQPDSLAFRGKLYLLTGPAVASAASLFAGLVKNEGFATIIGEESMGGFYGHTGHIPISYILPNTKMTLTFSIVDLKQYVTGKHKTPFGRGILPDLQVVQSQQDFMTNKDRVLAETLAHVRSDLFR